MIRFGLLGRITVNRGVGPVELRAPTARNLLAALLLNANRVVPVAQLVEVMWGGDPPATAVASLHNRGRGLRAFLAAGPAATSPEGAERAAPGAGSGRIRTVAPGYLIEVAAGMTTLLLLPRKVSCTGVPLGAVGADVLVAPRNDAALIPSARMCIAGRVPDTPSETTGGPMLATCSAEALAGPVSGRGRARRS
jgi:hypothetical protein